MLAPRMSIVFADDHRDMPNICAKKKGIGPIVST